MKRIFKILLSIMLLYVFFNIITPFNKTLRKRSIQNQINYISKQLINSEDSILQLKYPEGKVFGNAIFALSLIEYSNNTEGFKKEYSLYIDTAIKKLLSEEAKQNFEKELTL